MNVSILQENLAKGLSVVSRFVTSKTQLPILNNILIKTDQGRLKLSSTNLETGINFWLGAKVEKEGETCLPAKILTEYVSSLPPQKVNFELIDNSLKVDCEDYQASFLTLPTAEFPLIPSLGKKPGVLLKIKDLPLLINQVTLAASQDEGRPALTGVLLRIKKGSLFLVATDGYRLSVKEIKQLDNIEKLAKFQEELLVPAKALMEVGKILAEGEKSPELGLTITPKTIKLFSHP